MPLRVGLAGLGNAGFQVHGEVLRYMPDLTPIRALIDAGAIGRLRRLEMRFLWLPYRAMGADPTPFSGRWQDSWNLRRAAGGALLMFGPHLIDQLLFALDYHPRRV